MPQVLRRAHSVRGGGGCSEGDLTYLAFMASHDGGIPDWIPIGISLLALAGTLGNYLLTLSRGRKRVHIQTSIGGRGAAKVRCRVTNTGYIGLQVQSVRIRA